MLTVDTVSDVADGNTSSIAALLSNKGADGRISLREAILAANNSAMARRRTRSASTSPDALIGGAHTIRPTSALPTITGAVVIDATTEPDYTGTPVVEIDGSLAGGSPGALGVIGLHVSAGGSTIKGLAINQFSGAGIRLDTNGGNVLQANYIGTDVTGLVDRGNGFHGVYVLNVGSNLIGGNLPALGNLISGNDSHGILLGLAGATGNVVQNNRIGTAADGVTVLGNSGSGIVLSGSPGNPVNANQIGNNTIAWNGGNGISLTVGSGNSLLGNRIHSNTGLGIDLGNDGVHSERCRRRDSGSNGLPEFPADRQRIDQRQPGADLGHARQRRRRAATASSSSPARRPMRAATAKAAPTSAYDRGHRRRRQRVLQREPRRGGCGRRGDQRDRDRHRQRRHVRVRRQLRRDRERAAVVTLPGGGMTYTENAAAVVVNRRSDRRDIDSADFDGGT